MLVVPRHSALIKPSKGTTLLCVRRGTRLQTLLDHATQGFQRSLAQGNSRPRRREELLRRPKLP
jgi:hypothetical protein